MSALIWCEVLCGKCGVVAGGGFYSSLLIRKLKWASKGWIEDEEYGVLCPDCAKKRAEKEQQHERGESVC